MSLINDALKKAQKQRTGDVPSLASMPSVGGETPHRIAKRAKPAGFETLLVRAGVGLGVLLVVVVGGYFAFRSDSEEKRSTISDQPSASPTLQVSSSAVASAKAEGLRSQVSAPASAPAPAFTLPVAQVPAPSPQAQIPSPDPQVSSLRSQVSASQQPATARSQVSAPPAPVVPAPAQPTGADPRVSPFSPPSASNPQVSSPAIGQATAGGLRSQVSEPARPALKLEPRAIQFIENIKVAGIMARPTDSKVLMNDRVYRIGSLVEAEMGLTLVGITPNSLTFEDGNGARYTRTF